MIANVVFAVVAVVHEAFEHIAGGQERALSVFSSSGTGLVVLICDFSVCLSRFGDLLGAGRFICAFVYYYIIYKICSMPSMISPVYYLSSQPSFRDSLVPTTLH